MAEIKKLFPVTAVYILLMYMAQSFFNRLLIPYPFNPEWIFYFHVTLSLAIVVSSYIIFRRKPRKTGFIFLIWSGLKIMFTMAFFLFITLKYSPPKLALLVTDFMVLYAISLLYELWWGTGLLKKI